MQFSAKKPPEITERYSTGRQVFLNNHFEKCF
jgi:hypothetical protein